MARSLLQHVTALLLLFATAALAAQEIALPSPLRQGNGDAAMPELARRVMAVYRDDDPQRRLGTVFRLQLAAGQYPQAIESIQALRALRGDAPSQPPLFLQYEIHAQARLAQARQGIDFTPAWRQAFAETFGALDDRTALQAEAAFNGGLPRMRNDLEARIAQADGKRTLAMADAIELVRAWQVHAAYAAFQPHFAEALAEDDARRYTIDRDLLVRTPDGAHIAALVIRPAKAAPLPVLLGFTIYANDDWAWADAKTMAAHGYAGVVAYSRGKGRSPDAIAPFEHDGSDAASVIAWAAAQPWNDGRVGMYGGSYNGYAQWAALKQRPAALKAIATSATAAPGIDVPMEGGVFLNFMYPWPFYTASNRLLDEANYGDSERWQRLHRNWYASGRAYRDLPAIDGMANPVFARWLQHPTYDGYWQAMTPQGPEFAAIGIPVLATTGYFDGAQIGALHYFREHLRQRPAADHTLLIGPYEHLTLQTGVPPMVQGYAPDPVARQNLQALRLAWFDHVFKGAPKPELLAGRVNWQVMGANTWRHAPTLEAMSNRRLRLYLLPGDASGHRLSVSPVPQASSMQRVDFSDRSGAGWVPADTVLTRSLDAHAGLVFRSETLMHDTELAGPFAAELEFVLNKHDADIAISILEQNADGEYLELAWGLQRLSHAGDRRQRQLLQPGMRQRVRMDDTRLLGRRLAAGSRLVVTLGVIKQPDRQLNLGSGKPPAEETLADAGEPLEIRWFGGSHLDFPVRD